MPTSLLSRVLGTLLVLGPAGFAQARQVSDAEVERVHKSALLIDTHNDITSRTVEGFDIGKASPSSTYRPAAAAAGERGRAILRGVRASSYVEWAIIRRIARWR